MSVYVDKTSKVIIQGFTGQHATFHAEEAMGFGTQIVGGVTPGKGGSTHLGLPVFNSVAEAVQATGASVSGIFTPPAVATDSLPEGLTLVPGSLTGVSGIDTIWFDGRVIIAVCSAETPAVFTFVAEVVSDGTKSDALEERLTVRRTLEGGRIVVDRSKPVMIRLQR